MARQSLAARAVMAVCLTIGFYALALGIVAALLGAVYAEVMYSDRILIRPTLFAVVAAAMILWSILPRIDRFVAPGPRLDETRQPELFTVLRDVSGATGEEMPSEVYLLGGEVNAWVAQRGGVMGIGSRRVMAVGLPLLESVTVPQFRAIIAHEFGHFHGSDTKLGPWIYKTRQAIFRTVNTIGRNSSFLHKPFIWYGSFFMRVTQSISRAQELAADVLAANVAGARNAMTALVAVERSAAAYDAYWTTEVVPVLSYGFRPPIAAGLSRFLVADEIDSSLRNHVDRTLSEGKADVYDSHPPLRDRIAALEPLAGDSVVEQGPMASTLLRDLDSLETDFLLSVFVDPSKVGTLQTIDWQDTGAQVYVPQWRERIAPHAAVLHGVALRQLSSIAKSMAHFAGQLDLEDVEIEKRTEVAQAILGCALAVVLSDQGWSCDATPGRTITMSRDGRTIAPFSIVPRVQADELSDEEWVRECETAGLADRTLA